MPLLTTAEFIENIKSQDPKGTNLISFRVYNEDDHEELIAHGEITGVELSTRYAHQTDEGDRDILRVSLRLDCHT